MFVILTSFLFLIAMSYDIKSFRIPNKLSFSFLLVGILLNSYEYGWSGLALSLAGAALMFILLFPVFAFRLLGAGDVKLMMAVGALIGPIATLWTTAWGIISGGALAILLALRHTSWSGIKQTIVRYYRCFYLRKYFRPESNELGAIKIPYAPALAIGFFITCYLDPALRGAVSALFL